MIPMPVIWDKMINGDGVDTSDATATAGDIAVGKTAYVNGEKVEGTKEEAIQLNDNLTGEFSFAKCVKKIILPYGITSIGNSTFSSYINLTNIDIPDSVTSIGQSAFSGCSNLKNIIIPNNVTSISANVFKNCTSLANINVPGSVTSIGGSAFSGCSNLVSINFPDSITNIDSTAFNNCTSFKELIVSKNSGNADAFPFSKFTNNPITDIIISDGITSINNTYMFNNFSNLENLIFSDSVSTIKGGVINRCSNLRNLYFGKNISELPHSTKTSGIDQGLCEYCRNLETVTIAHKGEITIGWWTFLGCYKLAHIFFGGTEQQWNDSVEKAGSAWDGDMGRDVTGGTQIHFNYTG